MSDSKSEWTISYKQIGVIIASFSIGLIVALLISNSQGTTQSNFTTTELIGFVLSVVLSGASIVLAISAISLGKLSEQSVIERSDESIRLQNEVFVKTTEALLRIESSTGVTEKRIEDIISGRVGDISHQVAEIASRHSKQNPKATKELEESIRASLLKEVKSESPEEREQRRLRRLEAKEKREILEEKYQIAHDAILLGVGNDEAIRINKMGHGNIDEDGVDFDGLFEKGSNTFAVSTFRPGFGINDVINWAPQFVTEINKSNLSFAFFVFFHNKGEEPINIDKLTDSMRFIRQDALNKMVFLHADIDNSKSTLDEIMKKL